MQIGDLFGLFSNVNVFLVFMIVLFAGVGLISGKLSVAALAGLLYFTHVSIETDLFIFDNLLYIFIITIITTLGFRVRNYVMGGGDEI